LVSSAGAPLVVSMFVIAGFLFPDGRLPSRRAGLAVKLTAVAAGLLTAALALDPRGLEWYPSLPNPLAVPPDLEVIVLAGRITAVPLLLACVGFLLASLADRYRHGGPEMRAQLRWFLFAGIIVLVTLIPAFVGRYFLVLPDEVGEAVFVAAALGLTTFPVTAAIAISRYHLFDIDRVITRALIYIPLMAVAGGLYTTFVVLFQRVFVAATGETSDAVIVLTTLALAVGFTYARRALEGFVDRRFNPRHASAAAHPGRQVQAASAHQAASVDSAAALGRRVSALESAVTHLEDMLQGRTAGSVDVNARLQDVGEWSDLPPHPHEGRSGSATSTVVPPDSAG
jgi:nitroreductase